MDTIKYIIADDHKIFRQGLRYALSDDQALQLTGEAEDGHMLLELLKEQQPDVVLLDLKMPGMDGIETTKVLNRDYPLIKILMLTTYDDAHFIVHLLELGAHGYLLKNAEPEEIKRAIHFIYANDHYFNHLVSNVMLKKIMQKQRLNAIINDETNLNEREIEVLILICKELTTTEIAAQIFLSPRTVEGIRTSLIEKIKVKNTAGLVIYAVKHGII